MTATTDSISAAVLGATGYVGGELLRLIAAHPQIRLGAAVSGSRGGDRIGAAFPHLAAAYDEAEFTVPGQWAETLEPGSNVALFSAAPHGASAALVANAMEQAAARNLKLRVVDCSADFRYADAEQYRDVYGSAHAAPSLLDNFHCAVPEHSASPGAGRAAEHIGHPGCFATAVLLAAVPLVRSGLSSGPLFVNGITGSTGSGRSAQPGTHHPERHSNLYAYKPLQHRHVPEIVQLIKDACNARVAINFVPHSGPFARGIYVTLQASLVSGTRAEDVRRAFVDDYAGAAFVRLVDGAPKLKDVVASNWCHIGIRCENDSVVVMSAIDNLVKGAAGGALQWMNRLWSLPETSGLLAPAPAWT
ncbi:MAG: N-acetyl-gamma-glutamyl-phosphate reductase [Woeseia sp.]